MLGACRRRRARQDVRPGTKGREHVARQARDGASPMRQRTPWCARNRRAPSRPDRGGNASATPGGPRPGQANAAATQRQNPRKTLHTQRYVCLTRFAGNAICNLCGQTSKAGPAHGRRRARGPHRRRGLEWRARPSGERVRAAHEGHLQARRACRRRRWSIDNAVAALPPLLSPLVASKASKNTPSLDAGRTAEPARPGARVGHPLPVPAEVRTLPECDLSPHIHCERPDATSTTRSSTLSPAAPLPHCIMRFRHGGQSRPQCGHLRWEETAPIACDRAESVAASVSCGHPACRGCVPGEALFRMSSFGLGLRSAMAAAEVGAQSAMQPATSDSCAEAQWVGGGKALGGHISSNKQEC